MKQTHKDIMAEIAERPTFNKSVRLIGWKSEGQYSRRLWLAEADIPGVLGPKRAKLDSLYPDVGAEFSIYRPYFCTILTGKFSAF